MRLLFNEGAFHHEVARGGGGAFFEAALFQQGAHVFVEARAAANHDAVVRGVDVGQAQILGELI